MTTKDFNTTLGSIMNSHRDTQKSKDPNLEKYSERFLRTNESV